MDTKRVKRGTIILAVVAIAACVTGCSKEADPESDPVIAQHSPGPAARTAPPPSATESRTISRLKAVIEGTLATRIKDEELLTADPNQILTLLASYENDSERNVRRTAYVFLASVAALHTAPEIRQEVVRRLVRSVYDDVPGDGGDYLMGFRAKDFDELSKDLIRQAMSKDRVGVLTIKLAGIANLKDTLALLEELSVKKPPDFNNFSPDVDLTPQQKSKLVARRKQAYARSKPTNNWYFDKCWHAKLARARMAVKRDIVRCIELVESIEDPYERVRHLRDMGYIRRPETIAYLCKYLDSSRRMRQVNGEPFASRAASILAESIEGFPAKQKLGRYYSDEEIELCRKWMGDRAHWRITR